MLEHYFATLFSLKQPRDLAHSALPDAPVRPEREDRRRDRDRRQPVPPPPPDRGRALPPSVAPVAAGPDEPTEWDPCPCREWGAVRGDRHGCVALVKELFPRLDRELDAWDAEHGWLYR